MVIDYVCGGMCDDLCDRPVCPESKKRELLREEMKKLMEFPFLQQKTTTVLLIVIISTSYYMPL